MNRTSSFALGLLLVACMPIYGQQERRSDETGTLAMAGRTASGVVISIDSAITESPYNVFGTSIENAKRVVDDGGRKLIDIGPSSACSINGFVGNAVHRNDLASDIRDWVQANPTVNASKGLRAMLQLAANSWNKEHYSVRALPRERKVGDLITNIVCGDQFPDGPGILLGHTSVNSDGTAVLSAINRTTQNMNVDGMFDTSTLECIVLCQRPPVDDSGKLTNMIEGLRNDITNDPSAMKSLHAVIVAQQAMPLLDAANGTKTRQSTLSQTDLQTLFIAVYKSVELHVPDGEVGAPNNARLIAKCGRLTTAIESPWPTCDENTGKWSIGSGSPISSLPPQRTVHE